MSPLFSSLSSLSTASYSSSSYPSSLLYSSPLLLISSPLRVSQVNKKSMGVMTADGKTWSVKDLKAVRMAEGEPSVEILLAKRKRTEEDKLR